MSAKTSRALLLLVALTMLAGCHTATSGQATPAARSAANAANTATTATAENAEIAALPDGPGKTLVAERCLLCHGAGLIAQQHKDNAAWGRTVTQMRTWGTPIQDEDQAALVAYLSQHFGTSGAR